MQASAHPASPSHRFPYALRPSTRQHLYIIAKAATPHLASRRHAFPRTVGRIRRAPASAVTLAATLALATGWHALAAQAAPGHRRPGSVAIYDPVTALGPLFPAVQLSGIFADSKTFVDARPLSPPAKIAADYARSRSAARFDLRAFVRSTSSCPAGWERASARTPPEAWRSTSARSGRVDTRSPTGRRHPVLHR